jgi:hypothetical protein
MKFLVISDPIEFIDGSPLLPDSVSQAWNKAIRRAGLKVIRLHDARHSHASLMLKQGIHPKVVQERLGHASVQVTLDTYSHVVPGIQQMAATRLDDIFKNAPKNEALQKVGWLSVSFFHNVCRSNHLCYQISASKTRANDTRVMSNRRVSNPPLYL